MSVVNIKVFIPYLEEIPFTVLGAGTSYEDLSKLFRTPLLARTENLSVGILDVSP
tara:strand:- start:229 stop:393 length:165 start_codon:yes stop_codon:yes gene_type:complete